MLKSMLLPVSLEHTVKIDVGVWLFVDRKGEKEGLTKVITIVLLHGFSEGSKGEKDALKEFIITDCQELGCL